MNDYQIRTESNKAARRYVNYNKCIIYLEYKEEDVILDNRIELFEKAIELAEH